MFACLEITRGRNHKSLAFLCVFSKSPSLVYGMCRFDALSSVADTDDLKADKSLTNIP